MNIYYTAFIGALIVGATASTRVATNSFAAGSAVFFGLFALWMIVWERPQ